LNCRRHLQMPRDFFVPESFFYLVLCEAAGRLFH
jgi:hypothetical protein